MGHAMEKIRLGVSACLLGEKVRYDGGHKLDRFIRDTLGQYVEFVPVCPELECGLPAPREAMHLEGDPKAPRLVASQTGRDLTEQMTGWAEGRVEELAGESLCGFIFKMGSPSCGVERVKLRRGGGPPEKKGVGLFALRFMGRFPLLPVEDEERLHDPELRENFIERIFVHRRWRELLAGKQSLGGLVDFHTRHKLLLLSHSPRHYRELGRLVAEAKKISAARLYKEYQTRMMEALLLKATRAKHANVLQHLQGYFKKRLTADEKEELAGLIDLYRRGRLPLVVPATLINHYVRKYDEPYLKGQAYLSPHPLELLLRNHV